VTGSTNNSKGGRSGAPHLCHYCGKAMPGAGVGWIHDTAGGLWCSEGCYDEDEAERLRSWHEPMTTGDPLGMDEDGPWDADGRL
jgi:hypothetical protein